MSKAFFDANVLLYLFSQDGTKAETAGSLVQNGGSISVQVLNEFVAIARRELRMSWTDARIAVNGFSGMFDVSDVTAADHWAAIDLAERHRWQIYDAVIVAVARRIGAEVLYTEELQSGQRIGRHLRIENPFAT